MEFNFFETLRNIYTKKEIDIDDSSLSVSLLIFLSKWLALDSANLNSIKKIIPYIFYIKPKHFYYLLFFSIPKTSKTPFLRKVDKIEKKGDLLLNKLCEYLEWSPREYLLNKNIFDKIILSERKYWEKEFGIVLKNKKNIKNEN